jgi:hypothetical protein
LVIECGDGVWFTNGHIGFAYAKQIHLNAQANSALSLLDVTFDNIYADGNNSGSTSGYGF